MMEKVGLLQSSVAVNLACTSYACPSPPLYAGHGWLMLVILRVPGYNDGASTAVVQQEGSGCMSPPKSTV